MYLIPILIALEILVGVITASPARNRNVLGESDTTNISDQQPTDTLEPLQDQTPPEIPTEVQTETETESPPTEEPTDSPPEQEVGTSVQTLDPAIFSNVTEKSPADKLFEQTINEVQNENEQLDNAKTPQEQANLLVQFEANNVQTLNTNMNTNKFDDVAFTAEKLSYQIDKTIDIIQNLNPKDAQEFRNKIDTICKNTEYLLRPGELVVPESLEQTLEVTRGKCFNFEKQ